MIVLAPKPPLRPMRLVLFALVIGFVYLLLKGYLRSLPKAGQSDTAAGAGPEDMVRCSVCNVATPRSEAIYSHGRYYCSPEHHRASS